MDLSDAGFTVDNIPKLYVQCSRAYKALEREAKTMEIDGKQYLVYKGHITVYLSAEVGITTAQYGRVMKTLREMGCVQQYKRGSGKTTQSEWVLAGEPTPTIFAAWKEKTGTRLYKMDLQKEQIKQLESVVRDLQARLNRVESDLGIRE